MTSRESGFAGSAGITCTNTREKPMPTTRISVVSAAPQHRTPQATPLGSPAGGRAHTVDACTLQTQSYRHMTLKTIIQIRSAETVRSLQYSSQPRTRAPIGNFWPSRYTLARATGLPLQRPCTTRMYQQNLSSRYNSGSTNIDRILVLVEIGAGDSTERGLQGRKAWHLRIGSNRLCASSTNS